MFPRTLGVALFVALSLALPSVANAHTPGTRSDRQTHINHRAKNQRGAPYRYGGTSPSGFDCSGFTRWVFKGHGADLPHSSGAQYSLGSRKNYDRIHKRGALRVGDLVFHKTTSARVGHAGIYVGGGRFISSTSSEGVRIRSLYDGYWGPRWVGGVRVPSLNGASGWNGQSKSFGPI